MKNSNIKPCWWGPSYWSVIYFMTAVYPNYPTKEEMENMRCFFKSLRHFLPCEGCKISYCGFSKETDTMVDNIKNYSSRDSLAKFVYTLRNKVNNKLAHNYNIDYNYFIKKLDNMILENNSKFDGRVCEMIEAPFIPVSLESKIFKYLSNQNLDSENTKRLLIVCKKFMKNPIFDFDDENFVFVYKRNDKCRKYIKKLNYKMSEGKYDIIESWHKDRKLHNKLLLLGCTVIHENNLNKLIG